MPAATLDDAAIAVAYLAALGGPRHAQEVAMLRAFGSYHRSLLIFGNGG